MNKHKQLDDFWLVEKYKAGHQNALTLLVKRWHIILCKQAYWYCKDYDIAKDIAQDCWRVVIDKIDSLNDSKQFGSWVLSIVNNKSKDWLRKTANSKRQMSIYIHEKKNIIIKGNETENSSINITQLIGELPQTQQLVIKLFYLESLTINEISKVLSVTPGTVKSRLFYAREKLKKIIKSKNYEK